MPFALDQCGVLYERGDIMDGITEYILSITAAGVICAAVKHIIGEKNASSGLIRVVCGIFMAVTVLSPLVTIRLRDMEFIMDEFRMSGEAAVSYGTEMANEALHDIIKQETEAYVLNEVKRLGLDLSVSVSLSETQPPVPVAVTLTGDVSPYHKKTVSRFIEDNLGVGEEYQIWI